MKETIEHIYAYNTDPTRHRRQGNVSFEGMSFYSYATVIAHKYPNKNGDSGTLIMAGEGIRNSNPTQGHKSRVRRAMPGNWTQIWVDIPGGAYYGHSHGNELTTLKGIRECHDHMKHVLSDCARGVKDAKSYSSRAKHWVAFIAQLARVNSVSAFLRRKPAAPSDYMLDAAAEDANSARWEAKVAEINPNTWRAERFYRDSETPENIEKWRNRKWSHTLNWNGTYLRLSKDGENVETSRRAVVPSKAARVLFRLCRAYASGKLLNRDVEPITVGIYSLRSIAPNGDCVVGCHHLSYAEMEKLYNENPETEETT